MVLEGCPSQTHVRVVRTRQFPKMVGMACQISVPNNNLGIWLHFIPHSFLESSYSIFLLTTLVQLPWESSSVGKTRKGGGGDLVPVSLEIHCSFSQQP